MLVEVTNPTDQPITACHTTYSPRSTRVLEMGRKQYHLTAASKLICDPDTDPGLPWYGYKPLNWIVSGGTWQEFFRDPIIAEKMAGDTVYAQNATPDRGPFPPGIKVVGLTFHDWYEHIKHSFDTGALPPGSCVVYVMENSPDNNTPTAELDDPVGYAKLIKDMLAGSGVTFIHSISLTAATYMDPQKRGDMEAGWAFIENELAYKIALHADVAQGQSQRLVGVPSLYQPMNRAVSAQGKQRGGKDKPILGGITTTKSDQTTDSFTVEGMTDAFQGALPYLDGMWFNVPMNKETGVRYYDLAKAAMRNFVW